MHDHKTDFIAVPREHDAHFGLGVDDAYQVAVDIGCDAITEGFDAFADDCLRGHFISGRTGRVQELFEESDGSLQHCYLRLSYRVRKTALCDGGESRSSVEDGSMRRRMAQASADRGQELGVVASDDNGDFALDGGIAEGIAELFKRPSGDTFELLGQFHTNCCEPVAESLMGCGQRLAHAMG